MANTPKWQFKTRLKHIVCTPDKWCSDEYAIDKDGGYITPSELHNAIKFSLLAAAEYACYDLGVESSHKTFARFLSHAAGKIAEEWNMEKVMIEEGEFFAWNNEHTHEQVLEIINSF